MSNSKEEWKSRLQDPSREVRRAAMDETSAEGVADLIALAPNVDLDDRRHILFTLGKLRTPEAIDYITKALYRTEPKAQRTAARALAAARGREAVPELGELLRRVEDTTFRRALVQAIGRTGDASALPYLRDSVVKDYSREVRSAAAAAIRDLPVDWQAKADSILDFLEGSGVSRSKVDAESILKAIRPRAGAATDGPFAVADYIIAKALTGKTGAEKSSRAQAIFAELIVGSVDRDMELAGERLNLYQHEKDLPDEKLQMLRIQIGGETALHPILDKLEENLKVNFQQPIHRLNRETQEQWQRTVRYSQIGFMVRMAMSIGVFFAGMVFLGYSGKEMLFGNLPPERLWGPGISFVTALGTVLLLIYTGPLKEIRRSMIDLGEASAAFIGYVHRVLQVSHTFSAYYLQRQMTFTKNKESCDLIDDAMRSTIAMLETQRRETPAEEHPKAA
jgi:hypothetical protein